MNVNLTVDARELTTYLQRLHAQAPQAIAQAVNRTALESQEAARAHIRQQFTLRRPDFVLRQGVKMLQFARSGTPVAILGQDPKAAFLAKFERGGRREQYLAEGGRSIAIPTTNVRRNKSDVIPAARRPRRLLDSRKAFIRTSPSGRRFIFAPKFEGRGRGRTVVLEMLYVLLPTARVPARLGFEETIRKRASERWPVNVIGMFDALERGALGTLTSAQVADVRG